MLTQTAKSLTEKIRMAKNWLIYQPHCWNAEKHIQSCSLTHTLSHKPAFGDPHKRVVSERSEIMGWWGGGGGLSDHQSLNLSSITGQYDKKDALFVFGSAAKLCTVQIQATSSCSHVDMLWIKSSLSCLVVVGLCWGTVEFFFWGGGGDGARLTGPQSKRAGCQSVSGFSTASSWWRLDSSAGSQLHVGLLSPSGSGPGTHPLLDFSGHGHESLLHIGSVLGTGFQKGDAQRVCELLDTKQEEHFLSFGVAAKQNNTK